MDDAALVQEAVAGSVPAFTEIFSRHEPQVHDAALALLRDRPAAMAVTSATFQEASERLESLQEPHRLRVWLLAIARFSAALVAGERAGSDRQPALTDDDAERAQQAGLVWEATADLPLRERALLDLNLRQGLEGADLADALGVGGDELTDLLGEMEQVAKGLAGFLIMRRVDRRCPDLPLVLRGWDGHFTPLVCGHIAAHVDACRVCREVAATLPSTLALYASAPRAPLPVPTAASLAADDGSTGPETETPPGGSPFPAAEPSAPGQAS